VADDRLLDFDRYTQRLADEPDDEYDDLDGPGERSLTVCRDCGSEFDHEPDCMTAAALLQAQYAAVPAVSSDAEYGRAIRPLVEALLNAQGDTIADMKALGALFAAHNRLGGSS
jgi:hypothetical protein